MLFYVIPTNGFAKVIINPTVRDMPLPFFWRHINIDSIDWLYHYRVHISKGKVVFSENVSWVSDDCEGDGFWTDHTQLQLGPLTVSVTKTSSLM